MNVLRSASSSKIWPGIAMDFFCLLGGAISKCRDLRRCLVYDLKCWWSRVREIDFLLSSNRKIFRVMWNTADLSQFDFFFFFFFWFSVLFCHKSFYLYHVLVWLDNLTSQPTKQISFCTLCHLSRLPSHKTIHSFGQTISWCLCVSNVRASSKTSI